MLSTNVDFTRAAQSVKPRLRVYDTREMLPELKEQAAKKLASMNMELDRSRRNLNISGEHLQTCDGGRVIPPGGGTAADAPVLCSSRGASDGGNLGCEAADPARNTLDLPDQ